MILEVAILDVRPGQTTEFEAAFGQAQAIIASMPGYLSHELQRCVENPNRYVLLVRWRTLEDHTIGFRQSEQYQQWRALLHHFYDPFPTVEHFEPVWSGPALSLAPASADDFEALLALRIAAMRPSLEQLGRFDPERARKRLADSFAPERTRHIVQHGRRVGFLAVRPCDGALWLDHLYVDPTAQGQGIGAWALGQVLAEADASWQPVKLGALKGSAANRFYQRHGFVADGEGEWDIYYTRPVGGPTTPCSAPRPDSGSSR